MNCRLVLEDGLEFSGTSFGASRAVTGELVFNTAMTGYPETLTDPSYRGQILVATYPLVGNYGVPGHEPSQGLESALESHQIQVQGFVVQHEAKRYSHYAAAQSLGEWLAREQIPGITGVDTRRLTRHLREAGTMRGWLFPDTMSLEEARETADAVDMQNDLFHLVAPPEVSRYPGGPLTLLVVDVGAKHNIFRSLKKRDVTIIRAPWHADLGRYLDEIDGILIGNGPGDPTDLMPLVRQIRAIMSHERQIPILGICLGNQILALAAGAKTYKLPYGHRGVNQPVQDLLTRRCFITSQNHGYAVDDKSLPVNWEPWFVNINDGTNEGIRSRIAPFMSVQFHPEACPGPEDTNFIFDEFLRVVGAHRRT